MAAEFAAAQLAVEWEQTLPLLAQALHPARLNQQRRGELSAAPNRGPNLDCWVALAGLEVAELGHLRRTPGGEHYLRVLLYPARLAAKAEPAAAAARS